MQMKKNIFQISFHLQFIISHVAQSLQGGLDSSVVEARGGWRQSVSPAVSPPEEV